MTEQGELGNACRYLQTIVNGCHATHEDKICLRELRELAETVARIIQYDNVKNSLDEIIKDKSNDYNIEVLQWDHGYSEFPIREHRIFTDLEIRIKDTTIKFEDEDGYNRRTDRGYSQNCSLKLEHDGYEFFEKKYNCYRSLNDKNKNELYSEIKKYYKEHDENEDEAIMLCKIIECIFMLRDDLGDECW